MPIHACAVCNAKVLAVSDSAQRVLCAKCRGESMFDALPAWPNPGHAMLPGAHAMMSDDDEDGDEEEDEKPRSKKGKADDVDAGKFSDKPRASKKGKSRDDDDDDDRPRKKRRDDDDEEKPAKGGMGMGMILGIVGLLLLFCVCLPVGGGVAVIFLGGASGLASRQQAQNNAKQIGLAMHSYNDANRHLPTQRMGKADLSWRVTVLPYIEQGAVFNRVDPTMDWDKGVNKGMFTFRPMPYDCQGRTMADPLHTPWQVFTGPNTPFPGPETKIGLMGFTDGTSNTILVAEGSNTVPWPKAADIVVPPAGPVAVPQGSFIVLLADGSVRVINRGRADDNVMRLLINPKDGNPIPPGVID